MAINFSDSHIQTYLNFIDAKTKELFENKEDSANNLIYQKNDQSNSINWTKYAYIYIGALYHNLIKSGDYASMNQSQIYNVNLFKYHDDDSVYSENFGDMNGGYYKYNNHIYPCYFFREEQITTTIDSTERIIYKKVYCLSPHFRFLIEREDTGEQGTWQTYFQSSQAESSDNKYIMSLFKKVQESGVNNILKIKITNLKDNSTYTNKINVENTTSENINVGFNIEKRANNNTNFITFSGENAFDNFPDIINKIMYIYNSQSGAFLAITDGTENQTQQTGRRENNGTFFSHLDNGDINPDIIINISSFIKNGIYLENADLLQASYESLIDICSGINNEKNEVSDFFEIFPPIYDTEGYEPSQDVDPTMGVANIYDLWLNEKNKAGDTIALATLIGKLKTMLEQYRFNTTFVKEIDNTITPIEWDWDDLTFISTLDFSLSENKQALKNLFFITTLYQFYSQICSSDELLNDETIKCGVASQSKVSSLLTEKEYEEKLCRSTLTKLYNESTPVDGTKKNIQFLYINRQEGFGNNDDIKLLETEYADAITPYNGIDPYFNGKFKNSMGRQTSGNMSHCCAVNVGGTIRFYYDFYYKTRFHDKPIEESTVEPYAPKTKNSPHLHAVSTSATCPYAILDDTVGSRNDDAFLVMRDVDSAQLDPSNFCIVFIHGSHTGGLRLEKVQGGDTMTDAEYLYRNAMYGPDPLCCLPNPFCEDPEFEFYTNFERNYDTIQGSDFYEKLAYYCGDASVDIQVYANGMSPERDTPSSINADQRTKLQTYITQQTDYLKNLNDMYDKLYENDGAMCPKVKEFMEQKMPNIVINNKRYFLPVTVGSTYEQVSITVVTAQGDLAERIYVKKYLDDGKTDEVPSGNGGAQGSYPIGKWVVVYDQVTEDGKDIDSLRDGYKFDKEEQPTLENVGLQLLEVFKSGVYHQGGDDRVLNGTNDPTYPEDDDYAALYQKYAKWGWGTINEVFGNSRDYSQQST